MMQGQRDTPTARADTSAYPTPYQVQVTGNYPLILDADDDLVAQVLGPPDDLAGRIANARLLAAAPELLERLGDLLVDVALLTDGEPSHAEIMATVKLSVRRANALLVRLAEAWP
jgi:hypothetical protein